MRPRTRVMAMDEAGPGQERWMVSYADFITLLFAFFVVMYAISSVNEGKYRVLSDSLRATFGDAALVAAIGADEVALPRAWVAALDSVPQVPLPVVAGAENALVDLFARDARVAGRIDPLADVARRLDLVTRELQDIGAVVLDRTDRGIELALASALLFPTASSDLDPSSEALLRGITDVLDARGLRIAVEGFTDDQPIRTLRFPSNWELSAARAATVVRIFEDNGIDPTALSAVGYGPHRPVVDNEDQASRARNRRVVVVVRNAGTTS